MSILLDKCENPNVNSLLGNNSKHSQIDNENSNRLQYPTKKGRHNITIAEMGPDKLK